MTDWFFRQLYRSVQGVRREPVMRRLQELEQTQWLNREALQHLQWKKLRRLVHHAWQHVPFYRCQFHGSGINPVELRWPEDYAKLPILTKEHLRRQNAALRARDRRYSANLYISSGSTGPASRVYVDKQAAAWRHAAVFRAYRWMGIEMGASTIRFWGNSLDWRNKAVEVIEDWIMHRRTFSTHLLSEADMRHYYQMVRRFRPALLYAFTSAIYEFAVFLDTYNLSLQGYRPKAILVAGEPLLPHQRECLERVFGCPVYIQYGAEEVGPIAYECPEGALHLMAENVYVEVVSTGHATHQGTLLITNLNEFGMPLIRYQIGDVGVLGQRSCPCGRGLPLIQEVSGRSVDFIQTPDGRRLHGIQFDYLPEYFLGEIVQFQIIQKTPDSLSIPMVRGAGYQSHTLQRFEKYLRQIVGPIIKIDYQFTDIIPRDKTGKLRFVINRTRTVPIRAWLPYRRR